MTRILISGSRDWDEWLIIGRTIKSAISLLQPYFEDYDEVTIVHGACPTGADELADQWAAENGVAVERHPADWDTHGRRAGYLRNQEMVDAGADIVLVFNKNSSRGASMTARLAREAGLPVIEYKIEEG